MILATLAVLCGLVMLVWSADRFVDGAARTASYFKVPPMLIGMLVVGFGTSAPELMVSALSAIQNNPGIALGNAYGSNITNIALILGITALISPITVLQQVLRKELLVLTLVTGLGRLAAVGWPADPGRCHRAAGPAGCAGGLDSARRAEGPSAGSFRHGGRRHRAISRR